mmetsp:Transcript_7699/g.47627  ORF Transcript_7699/g.47627 Transcript_7699/m.47627 type:complete len:404 (+) Transcript_7699:1191-2402(+)
MRGSEPRWLRQSKPLAVGRTSVVRNVPWDSLRGQEIAIGRGRVALLRSRFLRHLHEVSHGLLGRALHHAVSDVQDVRSRLGAMDAIVDRFLDGFLGCEEKHGIDVSLEHPSSAQRLPRFGDVRVPIQSDHVGRATLQGLQLSHPAVGMEDHRHPGPLLVYVSDDSFHVRQAEHLELFGREVMRPRVEDLHHLCAAVDLIDAVLGQHVRQLVQEQVDGFGLARHGRLGVQQVSICFSFPRVRGQRPRCTDESHQRGGFVDFAAQRFQDGAHERELHVGIAHVDHVLHHVFHRSNRTFDAWSFPFDHVEFHADRRKRREDVAEEDHGIRPKRTPWLQGKLHGDLRRLRTRSKRILVRIGAEFRHVSPSLSHQPHRRAFHRFSSSRAHQKRILAMDSKGLRASPSR